MKRKRALFSIALGVGAILTAGVTLQRQLLVEHSIWRLKSESPDACLLAAKRLSELRATRAIPSLVAAMAHDEAGVTWECASALARISALEARGGRGRRRPEGLDGLTSDVLVDDAVRSATGELGSANLKVRTQASDKLVYLGDRALSSLVAALRSPDAAVRERCVEILRLRGDAAADTLGEVAEDDPDAAVRAAAVQALAWIGAPGAVPTRLQPTKSFERVLESKSRKPWPEDLLKLRQLTIDATTLAGETFGAEEISRLLTHVDSRHPDVSSYCLFALAALNQKEAVRRLTDLNPRPASVYGVLAEEASPEALEFLLEALSADPVPVRRRGAFGLGVAAGRWSVPLLISLLDDEPCRAFACRALLKVLGRADVKVLGSKAAGNVEPAGVKEWWQAHGADFLRKRSVPSLRLAEAPPTAGTQNAVQFNLGSSPPPIGSR